MSLSVFFFRTCYLSLEERGELRVKVEMLGCWRVFFCTFQLESASSLGVVFIGHEVCLILGEMAPQEFLSTFCLQQKSSIFFYLFFMSTLGKDVVWAKGFSVGGCAPSQSSFERHGMGKRLPCWWLCSKSKLLCISAILLKEGRMLSLTWGSFSLTICFFQNFCWIDWAHDYE